MGENDNITNENNIIESIEFDRYFLIVIQETTYDYNEIFWYSI